MSNLLKKLNLLSADGSISITNSTVLIFLLITAFRSLFSGVIFDVGYFIWKVESLDISATLPLMFSLLNYSAKRMETNKVLNKTETREVKNEE